MLIAAPFGEMVAGAGCSFHAKTGPLVLLLVSAMGWKPGRRSRQPLGPTPDPA